MRTFKFFWTTHKWTGITLSLVLATLATTGFLLLLKKEFAWIQPPTADAAEFEGTVAGSDFLTNEELFDIVFAIGHRDFTSLADIDRVDFRPDSRVFKVRSSLHSEIQVDAVTGSVLSIAFRRSDIIEQIHDGSFFAKWIHDYAMPIVAMALFFLVFSGLWLWLEPISRRRRRERTRSGRTS